MSLKRAALISVFAFTALSVFLFVQHEIHVIHLEQSTSGAGKSVKQKSGVSFSTNIREESLAAKKTGKIKPVLKIRSDPNYLADIIAEEKVIHDQVTELKESLSNREEKENKLFEEELKIKAELLGVGTGLHIPYRNHRLNRASQNQTADDIDDEFDGKSKFKSDFVNETVKSELMIEVKKFHESRLRNISMSGRTNNSVIDEEREVDSNDFKKYTVISEVANTALDSRVSTTIPNTPTNLGHESSSSDLMPQIDVSMAHRDKHYRKSVEKRGSLTCKGRDVDSEVIYWKVVPGDHEFESGISPHHGIHHDRYMTFEYDNGGWNNVRMSMECIVVMAHAMGRTLVIPPQQHLYLLGRTHKDENDAKAHDEMGFQDFFNISRMASHEGFHTMSMKDFLEKEAVTGGLKGILPPDNSSDIWGGKLWAYLTKVADATPMWMGRFLAMPDRPGNFSMDAFHGKLLDNLHAFGGDRSPVFYDEQLQNAHHIHFRGDGMYRVLQHHYAFVYFADPNMQSFYKRFIRDYMRYEDRIQCAGHELLMAVREEAKRLNPAGNGDFYALHVRRGDFQFKDVKISAPDIVRNLHFKNGTAVIPPGTVVYLSTDDPDGLCVNCYVNRQPCTSYTTPKPPGCPEDTSWKAFYDAGWKVLFLKDFLKKGVIADVNPNLHGMIESIVCSRAQVFAGTWFSTFTGYIHRLRGFHGLGEATYYHTTGKLMAPQNPLSVGHGFTREWRSGWTDDAHGELL